MSAKIDYLETLHELEVKHQILITAADQLMAVGPEGIKELAQQNPDTILDAIATLVKLAQMNHDSHKSVVEMYLQLLDEIESVSSES